MNLTLTSEDLKVLDEMIRKTPFEYAFPIFQFLSGKVQEATKKKEAEQAQEKEVEK